RGLRGGAPEVRGVRPAAPVGVRGVVQAPPGVRAARRHGRGGAGAADAPRGEAEDGTMTVPRPLLAAALACAAAACSRSGAPPGDAAAEGPALHLRDATATSGIDFTL